jgi:hypothetical protein
VGRLRGYGNAINAEHARAFIESYLESKITEIEAEPVATAPASNARHLTSQFADLLGEL